MAERAAGVGVGAVYVAAGAAAWLWERQAWVPEQRLLAVGAMDEAGYKNPQQL